MKKKMSKTKKQILALGMLALGGLSLGSLTFIPYLLRHWSTIQYEIVNFKSEFNQNEKKFTLGFELSDLDAYKLKYQPLQVKLYSDSKGKTMVSEHTAHYDDFSRSWKLDVDASKLTPGSRYYIGIDYKEGKTRFGAKKIVGFSKNVADFINVPAAVKSINFGKIDTGSAAVKVDFSDEIKSLEGKKVALEYYYLPKGQKVAAKDQVVTTYVDLTTVKEGAADFQLNNLLPDADYYVSGVKLISDGQTPRELTSAEQENIQLSEGSFFNTEIINLKVNKMSASDELDLGKFVLLTFDKTTNPQLAKVNNMPVEISYVNRTSKEHEIKVIRTTLVDNVISFHLNRANNHLLPLGSSFEIAQIKIAGANVEFDKGVSNVFYSQNGIVAIKSKTSGTTANVETTFASQDDISGLTANVDLSPLAEHKVTATIVPLENNLYKATFNISGLTNKTVYNINSISLDKLPTNTVFAGGEFDYRKFNFEEGVQRSFLTGINDLSVFIKAAPQIETNLVTYSFGFGSQSNYLNSKQLRLAYHLDGDGHTYYSGVATAAGNAVNFKLNEFLPGRKYHLDNIEIIGEPNINVVIDGDQTNRDFYTRAVVSDIRFENIGETSAKAKVFIKSDLEQWKKIADKDAGKVTLVYSAGAHNALVASTDIAFEPSKLVKKDDGFELDFSLTGLNRKTNYYIDNLIFDSPNTTTLFSGDNIVSLDKFFTTKFENASALSVNTYNVSQNTATVEIQFNPDTDSFLDGHKFRLVLKKNDQLISSGPDSAQASTEGDSTPDVYVAEVKSSTIRFDLTGLDAGSKYTVANLVSVDETGQDATQFSKLKFNFEDRSLNSQTSFYTSPDITSIETTHPKEQEAKVVVHLESQKPDLDYTSGISLAYLNKTTKVLEFATGNYDKRSKTFTFELGKTNPLQKVTDYEIQRIVAEQHEIPFAKTFNEKNKKFSTSAQTAQIIAVQQVGHSVNEIKAVLNFSNNDTYLNGETLEVQLNKHNGGQQVKTATAVVKNNSAEFDFTGLTEAGVQYSIGQITHKKDASKVPGTINFNYESTAQNQKDKLYTLGEIKNITYDSHKQPHSANVTIAFTDAESFLSTNPSTTTPRTAILKYKDDNNNHFSASAQINSGSVTFNLSNLKEFTQYTVESLEISQINGPIQFSTQAKTKKNFYTKVATISLNDVIYNNKTPTNSEVTLVFDSSDQKVINNKQVNVTLERNGQTNTNTDKQAHANIAFNRETNRYEAKLDFSGLTSGVRYDLKTLTIGQTQDDPSAQANSTITVNTTKITNEHKNSFATTGVVEQIRLDGQASDRQARITIQFQGDTVDQVAGFQNRSATLVYQNIATKQLVSDTQIIRSNNATFTLSNLAKQQTYKFVSLKLDGITDIQFDSSKPKTGVNEVNKVEEFTTSFASVEIIDIQQKVENDKTVVTVFFNPDIDEVAINNYQATLEYTPQGTPPQQKQTSESVNIDNFRAVFNLKNLKEVSTFDINAVTIKKRIAKRSAAPAPTQQIPTANFSNLLNTTFASKKIFYSAPKITNVANTTTDNSANLTITVDQPENTYTGSDVNALLVFKSTRTGTTDVKLIKGTPTNIDTSHKTFQFDLTGLDKFTNYRIEELRLNGNIINFDNDINTTNQAKKDFKTTATTVETPSFVQTIKKKNEVAANISFDPVKDWYLVGNKVSFNANINGHTKTFEAVVGSDGLAKLDITSDTASNFTVAPGENITFNTISVVDDKNLGLQNKGTLVNPATFKNDDVASATPSPLTLKSKDLITSVVQKNLSTNSAQIELKLATSERLSGELTLNYLNKQDGSVKQVKVTAPAQPSNGDVTFNINGADKVANLVDYQLQSVEANGETIGFDTDAVTIPDREFRTLPNSVNVTNITTTYNPQTKTAIAKVEFDQTARQFLVGKKVSLSYQPFLHSLSGKHSLATRDASGQEATIRPDGTVEFKLDGAQDPTQGSNNDVTINDVPSGASGTSTTTNTIGNLKGDSKLVFTNPHNTLIDGIKYQITAVSVLDSGITSFNTDLRLSNLENSKFSTLPISTYAYRVKTQENLSDVTTTIEAFYLTNENLAADQGTADRFAINLYNKTNNTVATAKAKSFTQGPSASVESLSSGRQDVQKYFWKITYEVQLEKASLYEIVSTTLDNKDIELSRYTNQQSGQSDDNKLKKLFTTPGTKTKVVGIEYDPIPFDDKATIKVKLDDVDGFVSKNNLQLKLSYEQKAGASMATGRAAQQIQAIDNTGSITSDGVATFELTHLQRASRYEIKKIELVGHDAINTGEGLKIETVTKGSQQASDFTFRSQTTNAANQTLFATRNQVTNIHFSQTNRTDGAGTLTVTFGQTGNQVAVDKGIVTFVDTSTGATHQEILANSASVFNNSNHQITFNLNNLKKIGTYRVEKVSIHGLDYFVAGAQSTFSTIPQVAKITNIQYSDLASNLDEVDNKLYGSGKIKVTFDSLESYLDGQTLRFTLRSKSGNITKNVSGLVQQDPNSNPYVDLTLDKQNFESTDSTDPNIVVGRQWEIQSVDIPHKNTTNVITNTNELNQVTFPLTGTANSGGASQGLEQLKEFQLPGYFSNVTLAQADSHTSSSIKLQSVQFSGDISKFQGKQVVLELDKNQGHEYFATANVSNGNTLSFTGLALDGLTGLTAYKVKSIKIDGVSYPISPNTNTTNIAYTNVEHFTVTNFEWDKNQSNHNTSVLKVAFDSKDSWLLNKTVVLKYKSVSNSQTHTLTAVKQTINNTTGELEATFNVDVNNSANAYSNSFDYGQHYEFMGVDLTDFDPHSSQFQPYHQNSVPTAIYASSLGMGSEAVRFYTEYTSPTIKLVQASDISNPEGMLNTFKTTISVDFNDKTGIATNTVGTWNVKFFKDYHYLEEIHQNHFKVINRRWDDRHKKFLFDIVGDLKELIDDYTNLNRGHQSNVNNVYFQLSYEYFKDPSRTEIKDINLSQTQTTSAGQLNLDFEFPKKYVEVTKIRGVQTTAYDYGIEMTIYDPFNIIGVTSRNGATYQDTYDKLYNSIFNNGNANIGWVAQPSGQPKAEISSPDGITWNYFKNDQAGTRNNQRIAQFTAESGTFYGSSWAFQNNKAIQIDIKVANIDKNKRSIIDFSGLSVGQYGQVVKNYLTKTPSPIYHNSGFRGRVRLVNTSNIASFQELPQYQPEANLFSILDISYFNIRTNSYNQNNSFSAYKKIWFNISTNSLNNLAGKALLLNLNNIYLTNSAADPTRSTDVSMLVAQNDDELQRVFVMPSDWDHMTEFWGTYTNQTATDNSGHPERGLRVTIDDSNDFFRNRNGNNKFDLFQDNVNASTILGPSPFLAPFKTTTPDIISYWDVRRHTASNPTKNDFPIYNYENTNISDGEKTWHQNGVEKKILNNYQSPFGVSSLRYDEETGELSVQFDWAKTTNGKHKQIVSSVPHKAYAAFVDNNGYLYYFGQSNGDGASFDYLLGPNNNTVVFNTRQQYLQNKNLEPKNNSILYFVGILVQPYISNTSTSQNDTGTVKIYENGIPDYDTRIQRYQSDADRKVTAIPGVLDYLKPFTFSRTYPVPILNKAAQDSLLSITYKN